jgi:xanthine dehydrogenase YagS FAD-binding subunit
VSFVVNGRASCGAIDGYNRIHAALGTSEQCIATHPSDMCVALACATAHPTRSPCRPRPW